MDRLLDELPALVKSYDDELVVFRRDLHAHPEVGRIEIRTTRVVRDRLLAAGLVPQQLSIPTGLVCDIGEGDRAVALRSDLDALPGVDEKDVPYRSTVIGVCHACGHDVHTSIVLGAGLVLADLHREGLLPGRVRLIFQPAEEVMPGGALDVITAGGLTGVDRIFGVHCDPRLDTGLVGLRAGPITSACDLVRVRLRGRGGHTARPHLTADLVYALAKIAVEVPAGLSRRVDPRAGRHGVGAHRRRIGGERDPAGRRGRGDGALPVAGDLVPGARNHRRAGLGGRHVVRRAGGDRLPAWRAPGRQRARSVALLENAAHATLGAELVTTTDQSLGGEDFAWYLQHIPGAMLRLGVRRPGDDHKRDLHQGSFDADERAIALGVRLLSAAALMALGSDARTDDK